MSTQLDHTIECRLVDGWAEPAESVKMAGRCVDTARWGRTHPIWATSAEPLPLPAAEQTAASL